MPAPDRELRRMIVRLAALAPDDCSAVLADLDADQRNTVERLLGEFAGAPAAPTAPFDLARFSPWIVRRLLTDRFDGDMTVHARETLRDCAHGLFPANEALPANRRRRSWLARGAAR